MAKVPIAVQMYTLREECEKDFTQTLENVANIGYDGVEFAGFYDYTDEQVNEILERTGLKVAGSHVSIDLLENKLQQVIEFHQSIGGDRLICPFFPPDQLKTEDDFKQLASRLNVIAEKTNAQGLAFSYHNHDFELAHFGDQTGLNILFDETDPKLVHAELDVYWLTRAGEDPVEWIKRYGDRVSMIHLKDMTTDGEEFFAELGTGGIDLQPIVEEGKRAGANWFVVEQDQSRRSALESIEISYNYAKEKKWV